MLCSANSFPITPRFSARFLINGIAAEKVPHGRSRSMCSSVSLCLSLFRLLVGTTDGLDDERRYAGKIVSSMNSTATRREIRPAKSPTRIKTRPDALMAATAAACQSAGVTVTSSLSFSQPRVAEENFQYDVIMLFVPRETDCDARDERTSQLGVRAVHGDAANRKREVKVLSLSFSLFLDESRVRLEAVCNGDDLARRLSERPESVLDYHVVSPVCYTAYRTEYRL